MVNRGRYATILLVFFAVTLFPAAFYGYRQIEENDIVQQYLIANNLLGLPVTKETALAVSDQIRRDFNTDESSFSAFRLNNRPFLREDVGFLLTHKEGLCGQGARVMVNLLTAMGFQATRINLLNRELRPVHTLVSVTVDGEEFFVDSINSTPFVNDLLRNYNLSPNHFNVFPYSQSILARRAAAQRDVSTDRPPGSEAFFDHYLRYSYEAAPLTKLLNKAGLNVRVLNYGKPSAWISALAEKPNTVMLIVCLMACLLVTLLFHKLRVIPMVAGLFARGRTSRNLEQASAYPVV